MEIFHADLRPALPLRADRSVKRRRAAVDEWLYDRAVDGPQASQGKVEVVGLRARQLSARLGRPRVLVSEDEKACRRLAARYSKLGPRPSNGPNADRVIDCPTASARVRNPVDREC